MISFMILLNLDFPPVAYIFQLSLFKFVTFKVVPDNVMEKIKLLLFNKETP